MANYSLEKTAMDKLSIIDMPYEVRIMIYTHLFEIDDLPLRVTRYGAIDKSHWPHPLSLTCCQLYHETSSFIQSHTVRLTCDQGMFPRTMKGKLPDHISDRIRVIHVARTSRALTNLPVPSRSAYPNLREIVVDLDGLGRCHGHVPQGHFASPQQTRQDAIRRGANNVLSDAELVSWSVNGKPIQWLDAQRMITDHRASHMRRLSRARGTGLPLSIARGVWNSDARL